MAREKEGQVFLSAFCKEIETGDGVVIFNSLHPSASIGIDPKTWNNFKETLKDHKELELFQILSSMNLIVSSVEEDTKQLETAREKADKSIPESPTTLYLVLTDDCNMKCTYCPFSDTHNTQKNVVCMNPDTAKRGIDFWLSSQERRNELDQLGIIFYGGEPLLNLETFYSCLEYIDQLRKNGKVPDIQLMLDTNGILLTDQIIELLKRHNVKVTIALDSFSISNDKYRKDIDDQGTYDRVITSLNMLQKYGIPVYLSMSITPANIDSLCTLPENLRQYGIRGVGINILRGQIPTNFDNYQTESIKALADFFAKNSGLEIPEFQTTRRFDAFKSDSPFLNCGGFGEHIVIHPDGKIGNCPWTEDYIMGDVHEPANYNDLRENNFYYTRKTSLPFFNDECLECEAISICGGKCIWADDQSVGQSKSFCLLSKEMLRMLVLKNKVNL